MNTSPGLDRLYNSIKFRDIFNAQVRECNVEAALTIAELFEPTLQEIRCVIAKFEHQLGVNPRIEDDYKSAREGKSSHQVKMNFMWEPNDWDDPELLFHAATFNGSQLQYIKRMLNRFSKKIGLPVVP